MDRVNRRELAHDASVYDAYRHATSELRERGADVRDVVMERELKREYQEFLQERNRDRPDSDGRPDRDAREIEQWAREHELPYFDERVHFPDVRIEYAAVEHHHHEEPRLLLSTRGMAKAIAVGPVHRGRLFHVRHKPLYAATGETDNRHRKPMSTGRMIERLTILDAVLDDPTFTWLATEFDQRSSFIRQLGNDLR